MHHSNHWPWTQPSTPTHKEHTMTPKETRVYRTLRSIGSTALFALTVAREAQRVAAILESMEHTWGETDTYTWEDTNAGVSLTYTVYRDYDITPDDAECYDAEALEAWNNDEWHYFYVTLEGTGPGGTTVDDSIGGIDGGDYWTRFNGMDTEEQVMQVAFEHLGTPLEVKYRLQTQALNMP